TMETIQKSKEELQNKTAELEELNAALNILLKKREEDKRVFEQNIIFKMKELIVPYLSKLRKSPLNKNQETHIDIIESHINEMLSPFAYRLNSRYHSLTPTEINVANLIKQGRKTKDIATLLNSSERAVEFHRNSLRKKFGLKNKKENLRTFLLSHN
ncbi:MAG: helix-turn-helix transcriptional regulator, partial [Thermodesulfovibrionales bacterium]|nr:helix-turn-helix transcriptional regulator [Thermodesulfovibrionales bacterium]